MPWRTAFTWLERRAADVAAVIHLGAISLTTVTDLEALLSMNVHFSLELWDWCTRNQTPLVYASSAASYGGGEFGFSDRIDLPTLKRLCPLNPYGWSKQIIDLRIARDVAAGLPAPPKWYGLKFFNVYGPLEAHKGEMRSVALKMYQQLKSANCLQLFRSHHPSYEDGKQLRNFVYVEDVVDVILWLLEHGPECGLYNVGTGRPEPFLTIAESVIAQTGADTSVDFIDMPPAVREQYQYHTEADITKLRAAGYAKPFRPLAVGRLRPHPHERNKRKVRFLRGSISPMRTASVTACAEEWHGWRRSVQQHWSGSLPRLFCRGKTHNSHFI